MLTYNFCVFQLFRKFPFKEGGNVVYAYVMLVSAGPCCPRLIEILKLDARLVSSV